MTIVVHTTVTVKRHCGRAWLHRPLKRLSDRAIVVQAPAVGQAIRCETAGAASDLQRLERHVADARRHAAVARRISVAEKTLPPTPSGATRLKSASHLIPGRQRNEDVAAGYGLRRALVSGRGSAKGWAVAPAPGSASGIEAAVEDTSYGQRLEVVRTRDSSWRGRGGRGSQPELAVEILAPTPRLATGVKRARMAVTSPDGNVRHRLCDGHRYGTEIQGAVAELAIARWAPAPRRSLSVQRAAHQRDPTGIDAYEDVIARDLDRGGAAGAPAVAELAAETEAPAPSVAGGVNAASV